MLTVGDAPEFLREGGVIQLVIGDTVQMRTEIAPGDRVRINRNNAARGPA